LQGTLSAKPPLLQFHDDVWPRDSHNCLSFDSLTALLFAPNNIAFSFRVGLYTIVCFYRSSWPASMSFRSSLKCLVINCSGFSYYDSHFWHQFNVVEALLRWNFISNPKLNTLHLNTFSNTPNTTFPSIFLCLLHWTVHTSSEILVSNL
jgi:hypothetical protein